MDLPKPYVGITGFKTADEVEIMGEFYKEEGIGRFSSYIAMFGFIVSEKRLKDPEKGGKESPPANTLPSLVRKAHKDVLTMMHYYTENRGTLPDQIEKVFSIGRMFEDNLCRALQLNLSWPSTGHLEKMHERLPGLEVVLQIPKEVTGITEIGEIGNIAKDYDALVDYVLIDPSGGRGISLNMEYAVELMKTLRESMPTTTLGTAGGFGPYNVRERIEYLNRFMNGFCIDAQEQLREKGENFNRMNIVNAKQYVSEAGSVLEVTKN